MASALNAEFINKYYVLYVYVSPDYVFIRKYKRVKNNLLGY